MCGGNRSRRLPCLQNTPPVNLPPEAAILLEILEKYFFDKQ